MEVWVLLHIMVKLYREVMNININQQNINYKQIMIILKMRREIKKRWPKNEIKNRENYI